MEQATADRGPGGAASLPPAEQHAVTTSDGTEIRLTHYALGTKGPIVLAPGYGNAARAFAVDTVPKNYVQYLGEHGYDVWLLDYRASPDLEASRTQFTVDDIAMRDWPAAIDAVRQHTGADSVQAMGHCVGGLSLFMAIGGGLEGLRSATFSSLAGHPIATPGNRVRAGAHLATMFKKLGIKGLNTDYDPDYLPDRAVELRDARAALPPRLRQPGRPAHLLRLRRRLRLLEHQRGDDGRGRAEHLRHQQHHVLRAHLADDPQEPRRRSRRPRRLPRQRRSLPHADLVPDRRAQPDVRAARAAAHATSTCARPTDPSATPTMSSRTTRTWTCGSARTPSATSSRPPSPSWSARTREHHRRRTSTRHGRHARTAALQDLFSYPVMSCLQDRRTRRVAQGVSLKAGDMSYESANEPSPLTPLEEAILIAAHRAHRRGDARRAAGQAQRQARARHAVPARHRPRRVERRQRPGDVDVHDQRRGHLAAAPPVGARGDGDLQGDPAALGGPHRGRLAGLRQRGQAQGLRPALRVPARVAVLPGLERPALQRARARRASCRSSTTRASTSTCC